MVGPDSYGIARAPHYLGVISRGYSLSCTGLSPSAAGFPNTIPLKSNFVTRPYICRRKTMIPRHPMHNDCSLTCIRFRLHPFRSPLLRASLRFLFLRLLRCFTSPGCRRHGRPLDCSSEVSPFGYPRIDGCLLLPVAFRSSLRPSSASGAEASPACP